MANRGTPTASAAFATRVNEALSLGPTTTIEVIPPLLANCCTSPMSSHRLGEE